MASLLTEKAGHIDRYGYVSSIAAIFLKRILQSKKQILNHSKKESC